MSNKNYNPARQEGETYEEYKERRRMRNLVQKMREREGTLFWDSASRGTYKK